MAAICDDTVEGSWGSPGGTSGASEQGRDMEIPLSVKESEKQPVEIEGGGSGSAEALGPGRGQKLPLSPRRDEEVEGSPKSATMDPDDDWFVSDSGSEEEEEDDNGNQGINSPFTVDEFPRASCDPEEQTNVVYKAYTNLRGPLSIKRYPLFKYGKHGLAADYKLHDTSDITVSSAGDCFNGCQCIYVCLIQFIDIKIAGYKHVQSGCANFFGFVAVRDEFEPLRNYVYRRGINSCEAICVKRKTGVGRLSLSSPARVISIETRALIEFELFVRTEALPEDEPKGDYLIEGCTELRNLHHLQGDYVFVRRMYGERCALDVKYMVLKNAVEARVEVKVIRLGAIDSGVNLILHAKTGGFDEVIRLFRGAAPEPGSIRTFVVAVDRRNNLDLYIEAAPRDYPFVGKEKKPMPCSWLHSFEWSGYHGTDECEAKLSEFAELSVKVIWKTYRLWRKAE